MDQCSREFIAEKARLRPEDLGLVRTARRSHNQLGLAYQIAFIRLTGRAPGQQPFEILEDLVGYVATGRWCMNRNWPATNPAHRSITYQERTTMAYPARPSG